MGTVIVTRHGKGAGCLLQAVYFVFIRWWLGLFWAAVSWLLMASIIGTPLGIAMINRLPKVIALREPDPSIVITTAPGVTVVSTGASVPQRNLLLRALWFALIGLWFSLIWMVVAYVLCLTIIGMPLGFWMFEKTPAVVSLRR